MSRRAVFFFFFSSRRRHTRSLCDWSSDVCSSDLGHQAARASESTREGKRRVGLAATSGSTYSEPQLRFPFDGALKCHSHVCAGPFLYGRHMACYDAMRHRDFVAVSSVGSTRLASPNVSRCFQLAAARLCSRRSSFFSISSTSQKRYSHFAVSPHGSSGGASFSRCARHGRTMASVTVGRPCSSAQPRQS